MASVALSSSHTRVARVYIHGEDYTPAGSDPLPHELLQGGFRPIPSLHILPLASRSQLIPRAILPRFIVDSGMTQNNRGPVPITLIQNTHTEVLISSCLAITRRGHDFFGSTKTYFLATNAQRVDRKKMGRQRKGAD